MRFSKYETVAGLLVEVPRGQQFALRPKRNLPISRLPRKLGTFVYQSRSDSHPSRGRLHQQQTQPGNFVRLRNQEHRADYFAIFLGDPATLALRVISLYEFGHDGSRQRLEALIISVLLPIEQALPVNNPA